MHVSIVVRSMNSVYMHFHKTYYPCLNGRTSPALLTSPPIEADLSANHIPYPLRMHQWQSVHGVAPGPSSNLAFYEYFKFEVEKFVFVRVGHLQLFH